MTGNSRKTPGNTDSKPHVTIRPWKERIAGRTGSGSPALFRKPIPTVFLGAGLLADSKYLLWRSQSILDRYPKLAGNASYHYQNWVGYAQTFIDCEDVNWVRDGYSLMYYLLIEPFALLPKEPDRSA